MLEHILHKIKLLNGMENKLGTTLDWRLKYFKRIFTNIKNKANNLWAKFWWIQNGLSL